MVIKEVRLKPKKKKKKGCVECKNPFDQKFKGQKYCGVCLDLCL